MIEILKEKIKESRKENNKQSLSILTTLLGEIQLESSRKNKELNNKDCESIVKKFIKSNNETLEYISPNEDSTDFLSLKYENIILESLLPKTLSQKEISETLIKHCLDAIIGAKNKGQAMGIAMKTLKSLNLSVNGKDVEEAVLEMVN
jgi:uncharacterized protein YqeY